MKILNRDKRYFHFTLEPHTVDVLNYYSKKYNISFSSSLNALVHYGFMKRKQDLRERFDSIENA